MKSLPAVSNSQDRLFFAGVSLVYMVVSLSLLLSWPLLWPDEAIFADTARGVLTSGHPCTAFVAGMESGSYWQPPAWFYFIAPFIRLFGYNILPLRIVSLLVGLLILWATFHLARLLGESTWVTRVGLLLLALNPNFVTYVKLVRMDGLCTLFTLLGLHAYVRFWVNGKTKSIAASSVLFGLAVLTHPLGVIGPATAGCHALFDRRRGPKHISRTIPWIIMPVLIAGAIWFLSARSYTDFWTQLSFQMGRKSRPLSVSLIAFVERYRSLPLFALLLPAALVTVWTRLRRGLSSMPLLLALGATISILTVVLFFEIPYHIYCLPFLCIASAVFLERYFRDNLPLRRVAMIVLLAVLCNFAAYHLFFNYEFHFALRSETDYATFTEKIAEEIPEGATVCLTGYPTAYWGLNVRGKRYRLFDETFLSDSLGIDLLSKAGWFVLVNGFGPEDDRSDVLAQADKIRRYAWRAGKTCELRDFVGARKRFAYTARIFQLQPIQAAADSSNHY